MAAGDLGENHVVSPIHLRYFFVTKVLWLSLNATVMRQAQLEVHIALANAHKANFRSPCMAWRDFEARSDAWHWFRAYSNRFQLYSN